MNNEKNPFVNNEFNDYKNNNKIICEEEDNNKEFLSDNCSDDYKNEIEFKEKINTNIFIITNNAKNRKFEIQENKINKDYIIEIDILGVSSPSYYR